jgi:hypothetical protein
VDAPLTGPARVVRFEYSFRDGLGASLTLAGGAGRDCAADHAASASTTPRDPEPGSRSRHAA